MPKTKSLHGILIFVLIIYKLIIFVMVPKLLKTFLLPVDYMKPIFSSQKENHKIKETQKSR